MAGMTLVCVDANVVASLAAELAALESSRADMEWWDPATGQRMFIQVKRATSPSARFSLLHELCHHHAVLHDANKVAAADIFGRLVDPYQLRGSRNADQAVAPFLALPKNVSFGRESSRNIRRSEPVWLSWTKTIRLSSADSPSSAVDGLFIAFSTMQLALDYRAARLCFMGGVIDCVRLAVARLVSVLAHQPEKVAFGLVMMATTRRYGRRSEPDDELPVFTLHLQRSRGAVCLVA